jgi:TatA/E family protein of Tat protein translocase
MFGSIGMPELVLIFVVALLVFGPKKLPDIGKSLGKGLAEFKRASDELKKTIENEIEQGKAEVSAVKDHVTSVSNSFLSAPALPSTPAETVPQGAPSLPATVVAAAPVPLEPGAPTPDSASIGPDSRPILPS